MRTLAKNNKKKIPRSHKRKKTNRMNIKIRKAAKGKNQMKRGKRVGIQFAKKKNQRRQFKKIGKQANHRQETRWSIEKTKNDFFTAVNLTSLPSKDDYYKLNEISYTVDRGLETCIESTMSIIDESE